MATEEKSPPRPWKIDDLLALGKREGKKALYLKAIPVLILENWVLNGRVEGTVANYVWTNDLARRLVECGLVSPFKPKGTSTIVGALGTIQARRNLANPPLMEYLGPGRSKVNLPYYESLLEDYRQKYRLLYPEDYERLFPKGEPVWGLTEARSERIEAEPGRAESEVQDEIQGLLATVERTLRDLHLAVERLTMENQNLRARIEARTKEAPEISFVHTSPDFHSSGYGRKVTTIKDTIGDMLKRAEHAIRISTRQMDMFTDDLIALKRHSPDMEITVLSEVHKVRRAIEKSLRAQPLNG